MPAEEELASGREQRHLSSALDSWLFAGRRMAAASNDASEGGMIMYVTPGVEIPV